MDIEPYRNKVFGHIGTKDYDAVNKELQNIIGKEYANTDKRTFVVARYKENTDWCKDCTIIQKDKDIPNTGREASSYLWFIVQNYDKLTDNITFCQGSPFIHQMEHNDDPDCVENCKGITFDCGYVTSFFPHGKYFKCDKTGGPRDTLKMPQFADEIGIKIPNELKFIVGAQFTLHKDVILQYPKSYYEKLLIMSNTFDRAPWILERLWTYIFKVA